MGWLKIPLPGEIETVIKLGIKSQSRGVGLRTSDSIWGLLFLSFFLFKHRSRHFSLTQC